MSAEIVLLAALFVAVPLTAKYVTAFEMRGLLDDLRRRERQIETLIIRLDAVDRQCDIVEGALLQVAEQRRWSRTRRDLMAEDLQRARRRRRPRRAAAIEPAFVADPPPVWEPEDAARSAAAAEAAA